MANLKHLLELQFQFAEYLLALAFEKYKQIMVTEEDASYEQKYKKEWRKGKQ